MNPLEEARSHLRLIKEAYDEGLNGDPYTIEDVTAYATTALPFIAMAMIERMDADAKEKRDALLLAMSPGETEREVAMWSVATEQTKIDVAALTKRIGNIETIQDGVLARQTGLEVWLKELGRQIATQGDRLDKWLGDSLESEQELSERVDELERTTGEQPRNDSPSPLRDKIAKLLSESQRMPEDSPVKIVVGLERKEGEGHILTITLGDLQEIWLEMKQGITD